MSWIQDLYETYESCKMMVGNESVDRGVPLLPICHTTQMAHVEIVLDENGCFQRARVIPKNEARTIIPCTEKSGGRTSGEAAHPLCDKLQYVAGDYSKYGGRKESYAASFQKGLEDWCRSPYSHPKAVVILKYIQKARVIEDLIAQQVFVADHNGKLLSKWEKKKDIETPKIFEVVTSQEDAFVRWVVEIPGEAETRVWRDQSLWDSWIRYYSSTKADKSLCYVTGREDYRADQHPAKLRNDGDKAKLISANDMAGFTFRGRFLTANQAAAVGFETTQKAHFALRWLISRQGYRKGDLAIVAWATSGATIPQPVDDPLSILGLDDLPADPDSTLNTAQEVAMRLKKKIAGYGSVLGSTTGVVVMALDSATPGRMAITYYQKLTGSDFLERINDWHDSCAWLHQYRTVEVPGKIVGKRYFQQVAFVGAPAPIDIAEAAYGQKVDDKLKQVTVARLLPCIVEERPIPRDLVESVVRRACNRVGLESWEWKKTLSIACSLFKAYHRREKYTMALDPERKTRDYLYGRLLALAESLEEWALNQAGEKRETNAARLMQRFAEHPYTTWMTIELALTPYKARLGGKSKNRQRMIDEVIASFQPDDFLNDRRLSGEFLLGYHCQREYLRPHAQNNQDEDEESN